MRKYFVLLGMVSGMLVSIPTVSYAQNNWFSQVIKDDAIAAGTTIKWEGVTLSIPPNAFAEETRVRIRKKKRLQEQSTFVKLSKQYRSKQQILNLSFSSASQKEVTIAVPYTQKERDAKRRRVFQYADEQEQWVRQYSVVHKEDQQIVTTLVLEQQQVNIVVGIHRYKKERPIKKRGFQEYSGVPFSDTAAVIDYASGQFLYREESGKQRSIASLTKIMTAYQYLQEGYADDRIVTYSDASDRIGAVVVMNDGEQFTGKQALMGTLMSSANNMAQTLAVSTNRSEAQFIADMNATAESMGLHKTRYVEATGLEEENRSTAGNVVRLFRIVTQEYPDIFAEISSNRLYQYTTLNKGRAITLVSTNKFDGHGKLRVKAFKTGYLPNSADRTLVMVIEEIATGNTIVLSLLGNPEYNTIFDEAYTLATWTFQNWEFHHL